jgi:hypothetical protein
MPVAMFGMFALWAAASNRHWFLRTAVVASAILVTLLVPAYEVVILLTVETAVVVAGLAIWRRRRERDQATPVTPSAPFRLRLSMETLLLAVVIVAVLTTLIARWPAIRPESWYEYSINGAHSGIIALTCVWLICGRARWWIRLAAAPPLVFILALTLVCLHWAGNIASYWFRVTSQPISEYLKIARRDIWPATLEWKTTIGLAMFILTVWLFLMVRAGWFDPFRDSPPDAATPQARRSMRRARAAAVAVFAFTAIFPLILFYEMLTPAPLPNVTLPSPNGYDDFLTAGRMIGPTAALTLRNSDQTSVAQLHAELSKHAAAFERLDEGLQKSSWNPFGFREMPPEDSFALIQLYQAVVSRIRLAQRSGDRDQELADYLVFLKLAQEEARGTGIQDYNTYFAMHESESYAAIWNLANKDSARECADLAATLQQLDAERDPLSERLKRQRILEENAGFERLVYAKLSDWSGRELYSWYCDEERKHVAQLRMLIIKLALRAYELDHDRLPQSLSELVPDYLQAVPVDPFSNAPFRYRPNDTDNGYILYSFGPDRDDDNGQPLVEEKGDLTDANLFPPSPPATPPAAGSESSP